MSPAELIQSAIAMIAAGIILWRVEPAINRMSRRTPAGVRLGGALALIAAVGLILHTLAGDPPGWPATVMAAALALSQLCDRRAAQREHYRREPNP